MGINLVSLDRAGKQEKRKIDGRQGEKKEEKAEESKEDLADTVSQMQALLNEEKENARETIPIVEYDSVLGFEPSMEYVCDRYRLEWKMSQVEREIERLSEFLKTKL